MPNPVAMSAGVIALSMAVATAIVVYESPEIRRMADHLRRRIAIALQSMGDSIAPDDLQDLDRTPVFNRPEDAEGFMLSSQSSIGRRGAAASTGGDPWVDADEESRSRQRDELLYWNRMRLEQQQQGEQERQGLQDTQGTQERWNPRDALEAMQRATREAALASGIQLPASFGGVAEQQQEEQRPPVPPPKTKFDGILRPDPAAAAAATDRGTYVVNTGADVAGQASHSALRRRGWNGSAAAATYVNPFGDEYGIELDEPAVSREAAFSSSAYLAPDHDDMLWDLYSASEPDASAAARNTSKHVGLDDLNSMDGMFDPMPSPAAAAAAAAAAAQTPAPATPSQRSGGSGVVVSEVYFDADNVATATVNGPTVSSLPGTPSASAAMNGHVYSSIQAWAQQTSNSRNENNDGNNNNNNSSSSNGATDLNHQQLPATPALSVTLSEPEIVSSFAGDSDGERTPVESVSTFWGEEAVVQEAEPALVADPDPVVVPASPAPVHSDAASQISAAESRDYEVVSDDGSSERSMMTPTSWSEVGSVVTESDAGMMQAA